MEKRIYSRRRVYPHPRNLHLGQSCLGTARCDRRKRSKTCGLKKCSASHVRKDKTWTLRTQNGSVTLLIRVLNRVLSRTPQRSQIALLYEQCDYSCDPLWRPF